MAKHHRVLVQCYVEIEINDPDVIERVTGTGGDEWRSQMYQLHTEADVLEHFAHNAVTNGVYRANQLDGWADAKNDAARFQVVDVDAEAKNIMSSWSER
jgi:hypothetical protein